LGEWYDRLKQVMDDQHLEPWQVWNTDETQLLADSRGPPKVATRFGRKSVIAAVRKNDEHVTMANVRPCPPPDQA